AQLLHVGNLFYTDPMVRLSERLAVAAELGEGTKVFFTNSGTEAVEAALKCARKRRRAGTIISVHRGFHGRTYGALSATPQ
ncbi:aminotransferase class III-fold pyridoxal phosphate-dependent enzyme, partial [Mesorhizobium sp. M1A.T.Ca.IN.004.03.1.1]|uniref:aminotransferase class III-fold pyridoxal phosphate-dependent enzyme n=1 Tax=Mesorhizobium sp. M1A.T.Ca.IN.004.03.1.1 TaxID=2496795 RepID=UPI000FCB0944